MHGRPPDRLRHSGNIIAQRSAALLSCPPEVERRDKIRGQIVDSSKRGVRIEHSDFKGEHVVECYVVKDGVVVARDRIDVPVSNASVKTANVS
jgi:hypothetical protein